MKDVKDMVKQLEEFMKRFPDATAQEKRDFLNCLKTGITYDYTIIYKDSPVVCIGGKWGKITPDGFEEIPDYIPQDMGDPYGLLDGSWNDYSNDYIQAEIISRANYNPKPDTEADRIIKDLLYLCAWYKLELQKIEKQIDDDTN